MSLSRETRSGRTFGDWTGPYITPGDPNLNVAELLKQAIRAQDELSPPDDLFSLSPLSSPQSSSSNSPDPASASLLDTSDYEEPEELDLTNQFTPDSLIPTPDPLDASLNLAGGMEECQSSDALDAKARRKRRNKTKSKANRKRQRTEKKRKPSRLYGGSQVREEVKKKYRAVVEPMYLSHQMKLAPHVKTAYTGRNREKHVMKTFTLEELVGEDSRYKMKLFAWDGKTPTGLVDQEGRMFGLLAGHPTDSKWDKLAIWAANCLEEARLRCCASPQACHGRRGEFTTLRDGVSHGGGQTHPKNLSNTIVNEEVLAWLNSQECFQRLAGFVSSVFATTAPELHAHYEKHLGALHEHDPSLKPSFPSTVFTATTYNLGPQTVCYPHLDFANLAFGWCSITALGSFDPKKGGHLVLWECGLVIEFPPGATVLIPSALVHHSNTPIAPLERRFSFTQYSAGALFRWVDHGFQKTEDYRDSLTPEALQELDEKNEKRWAYGLSLFPRLPSASTS
ncbi:hypothetical protein NLJ89_g8332 [Agrocybe chaxingu]|uniref:Uncharacterized protein n=1 Tax=Agrocybe chaxingu TaxID=84603 RepID=A0A9W8MUL1_9AGAR|nr:hypothetical protein NLJ89_g8332 [Agrocybe chaxingu]